MSKHRNLVTGESLIYQVIKETLATDSDEVSAFTNKLIAATSIWFPVETYKSLPTLVPWVTRDPSCRRPVDEWGAPDIRGFQRDDNSMIKNIPKTLLVDGPENSALTGQKIGKGFVASHIWRSDESKDANGLRNPRTNSFVPNLVWLPSLIAKLSDRQGSSVMKSLQSLSRRIYGEVKVEDRFAEFTKDCWRTLPSSDTSTDSIDVSSLHYFNVEESFIERRMKAIRNISQLLEDILQGNGTANAPKSISSRYVAGLREVEREALLQLQEDLNIFTS